MRVTYRRRSASSALNGVSDRDSPGGHGDEQRQAMTGDEGTRSSSSSHPDGGPVGLRALPRPVAVVVGGGG
ncbi:hypothetical protein, partial [Nonomuraea turkmeniaca]|uniref:hypothetical protein n=1 Tax=Nonomuraea turkmeniaca TaxID=103838 RepID=UPI001B85C29B